MGITVSFSNFMKFLNSFICSVSQLWHANQTFCQDCVPPVTCRLHCLHGWKYVHIYTEIRKIEMCIRRSPYFDNFQNKKNIFLFWFCSAIWSYPYTWPLADPCFLKLTRVHAFAGSGENCCELAGSLLDTSEKSRAVRKKKCCVCQKAMSYPSPLTKMWKTNGTGSGFRWWTRTEYHFDTDVESSMSRGLQLKN